MCSWRSRNQHLSCEHECATGRGAAGDSGHSSRFEPDGEHLRPCRGTSGRQQKVVAFQPHAPLADVEAVARVGEREATRPSDAKLVTSLEQHGG